MIENHMVLPHADDDLDEPERVRCHDCGHIFYHGEEAQIWAGSFTDGCPDCGSVELDEYSALDQAREQIRRELSETLADIGGGKK